MLAREDAYEADPRGYVQRGRTARSDRRVGLRPAPDTMAILTGFLPVEQGVACLAALRAHTDSVKNTGDPRTRDQIMADTLVERVTGQAAAGDVQAEVAIVVPVDALTDPDAGSTPPRWSGTARFPPRWRRTSSPGPGAAVVAAAVHRPARWRHRRGPGTAVFRRDAGSVGRLPRRRPVPGSVL